MAEHGYFLGANTSGGFVSRYHTLLEDTRLKKTVILKGGPGCGKSTLMRKVAKTARDLGCAVEEILCSSDPESLDGVVIPEVGLAVADGTAPHVLEPPLCGCGAVYLDLGCCYNDAVLHSKKEELFSVKAKNAACYPFATACFAAAHAADAALSLLAKPDGIESITLALCPPRTNAAKRGKTVQRFYAALTPKGAICCELPCKTVWTLRDNYGIASQILLDVAACFTDAGYDVITGSLPLSPDKISHVIVPEKSLGYAVVTEQFPYPYKTAGQYDLDTLCTQKFSTAEALHAQQLMLLREQSVREGLRFLQEAKGFHDELETLCRPAMDFRLVDEKTAEVCDSLLRMMALR